MKFIQKVNNYKQYELTKNILNILFPNDISNIILEYFGKVMPWPKN